LEDITTPSSICETIFEFGIAQNGGFNYLDEEEKNKTLAIIKKSPLHIMDFLCAIRYYRMEEQERRPLKFDYYMLRFIFDRNAIEIRIFHERGPMRISPEEIADFIASKTNQAFSKRILKREDTH